MTNQTAAVDYQAEVRFGVVMYGGVSLAVYINGVSHELFEMACATPLPGVEIGPEGASASREMYDRLSWLAGNPELVEAYAHQLRTGAVDVDAWKALVAAGQLNGLARTRFVIDVIAGTSAGGINGVYLAKALVNGEHFGALRDLWIKEGDIGLLLNDAQSREGLPPGLPGNANEPKSLLNSDRMYLKLLAALAQMQALPITGAPTRSSILQPTTVPAPSPLVEELDLYLTTTDIRGTPVPLRLFDQVVNERRHKQHFHFSYPSAGWPLQTSDPKRDFDAQQHAFLAFTARCTSSFPFAFEPMTLRRVSEVLPFETVDRLRRFDSRFKSFGEQMVELGQHVDLPFGDGGYLDNKPFSYVAETLSHRFGDAPAQRKLIYVEPDPEWLDAHSDPRRDLNPNALASAYEALVTIPMYETIREDLSTVLKRNRRIERVESLVHDVEAAIEDDAQRMGNPFTKVKVIDKAVPEWRGLHLKSMVNFFGPAVLTYRELRVYAVTDRLAAQLARVWAIDAGSDDFNALRAMVMHWRRSRFDEARASAGDTAYKPLNEFLYSFDFDYRVRRLAFLMRRIDRLRTMLSRPASMRALDPSKRLDKLNGALELALVRHAKAAGVAGHAPSVYAKARLVAHLARLKPQLRGIYQAMLRWRRTTPQLNALANVDRSRLLGCLMALTQATDQAATPAVAQDAMTPVERMRDRLTALLGTGHADVTETWDQVVAAMACLNFAEEEPLAKPSAPRPRRVSDDSPHQLLNRAWHLLGAPRLKAQAPANTANARNPDEGWTAVLTLGDPDKPEAGPLADPEERWMKRLLGESFLLFDLFDQTRFALYYETDTGEPATVDVVRISPVDATRLVKETALTPPDQRKLAGIALAHFSAFLDERWRRNDVLWGRLDGAERLIATLLPANDPATRKVRELLIDTAHGRILHETLVPTGEDELRGLLLKAMQDIEGMTLEQRLRSLMDQLTLSGRLSRARLRDLLMSLLSEPRLVQHFKQHRLIDRQPEPKATLRNAARAITITGKVLQGISAGRKGTPTSTMARWIARTGLVMQSLVAVSLPGSLTQLWWSSALLFVYSVEGLALVAGWLFSLPGLTQGALLSGGLTIGAHLITLVLRDQMRERLGWLRAIGLAVALALLGLASLGAWALYQSSLHSLLCEPIADSPVAKLLNFYCS